LVEKRLSKKAVSVFLIKTVRDTLVMSGKVVRKTNDQDQLSLLPPSYDDLVPNNHPVRIVNSIWSA
jgi:hypothetical protein